ncbi:hypothetical protein E8E13_005939 [Curvularia kusanoi]|uniref:Heterokaryon incompatibility domain-containing protein n=1 Tax=Curvularia kusanoi TaxID=90978 RepID=A0A9P4T856_CURKU|nr:hypothetical protein E8E13_005939 [Curvularia kusanoi]
MNIDFTSLPKNFQDAVTVTRGLGVKYLWIDALCIVQDDMDDWEKESGKMTSVYHNAHLVLGADMSEDAHGGFLEREGNPYAGKEAPIAMIDSTRATIHARWHRLHWNPCAILGDFPKKEPEPLSKRAWTLQEQMLASRMVHFAREELIWECDSALSCECMELDRGISDKNERPRYRKALDSPSADMFTLWYRVIINFSNRSITKLSDRLPALSGLAQHFQTHGAGPYLAGLWHNDLPRGLLWTSSIAENSFRVDPYRAPTWSWASIESQHRYDVNLLHTEAELQRVYADILDAKCYAAGGDSCGAVKGGWIKIRAPMFEIVYRESWWYHRKAKDTQSSIRVEFDFRFTPTEEEVLSCLLVAL